MSALIADMQVSILQDFEERAHQRYTEAVAMTNVIPWGSGGEAAAIFNETACRDTWLRARAARQAAVRAQSLTPAGS